MKTAYVENILRDAKEIGRISYELKAMAESLGELVGEIPGPAIIDLMGVYPPFTSWKDFATACQIHGWNRERLDWFTLGKGTVIYYEMTPEHSGGWMMQQEGLTVEEAVFADDRLRCDATTLRTDKRTGASEVTVGEISYTMEGFLSWYEEGAGLLLTAGEDFKRARLGWFEPEE